jgi:Bacterial protein of unknown function (DUF899)
VSSQEWDAARQELLVEEKKLTRARDALAAKRRRMPWMAVEKGPVAADVDGGGVHPQRDLLAGESGAEPELLPADGEVPACRHDPVEFDGVRRSDHLRRGDDDLWRGGRRGGIGHRRRCCNRLGALVGRVDGDQTGR